MWLYVRVGTYLHTGEEGWWKFTYIWGLCYNFFFHYLKRSVRKIHICGWCCFLLFFVLEKCMTITQNKDKEIFVEIFVTITNKFSHEFFYYILMKIFLFKKSFKHILQISIYLKIQYLRWFCTKTDLM